MFPSCLRISDFSSFLKPPHPIDDEIDHWILYDKLSGFLHLSMMIIIVNYGFWPGNNEKTSSHRHIKDESIPTASSGAQWLILSHIELILSLSVDSYITNISFMFHHKYLRVKWWQLSTRLSGPVDEQPKVVMVNTKVSNITDLGEYRLSRQATPPQDLKTTFLDPPQPLFWRRVVVRAIRIDPL